MPFERPRATAVLATLLLVCAAAPLSAATKIAALGEKWRWVADERFELLTNGPADRGRQVIEQLEAYRAALRQMTGGQATDPPKPVRIVLFEHSWDMTPYQPIGEDGKPAHWSAYFLSRGDTHYFAMDSESEDLPRTALEGYAHLLIWQQLGNLPLWLRTGLAEYFSAFRYLERENRVEIGRPIADHLQYLNSSSFLPLGHVLAMNYESREFGQDVPRWLFYAKSWLLVHYLQTGSTQRAGTLARFGALHAKGVGDVAALEQAAGCSLEKLDEELAFYQKKSLMSYQSFVLDRDPHEAKIESRPASREDAVYRLGEYLAALDPSRKAEADAHFAASGRPAPADQPAVSQITESLPPPERPGPGPAAGAPPAAGGTPPPAPKETRSLEELRDAVARAGVSDRDREAYAAAVHDRGITDWASVKSDLAPARRALRELLAGSPHREDLWSDLRLFYEADTEANDLAEGVVSCERALAGMPDGRERAWLEDTAVGLAEQEARRLRYAGKPDEGRKLIEARLAGATDPKARARAKSSLQSFDVQAQDDAAASEYQAAIGLVNTGKVEEGGAALRKLIAEHPSSSYADMARSNLQEVEAYLARRARRSAPPPPPPSS